MRILVLIHEYPPIGGGGGRVAQDLCMGLAKRGYELTVLTAHFEGLPLDESVGGVRVIRLKSLRREPYKASFQAMGAYLLAGWYRGIKLAREWKPDLIHVHFAVPAGALAWLLGRLTRIPYVLTAHLGDVPGGVPEKTGRWFHWIYPFTPPIWRQATRVVAVSEHTRQLAQGHYPVPIQVIPNGVDLSDLEPGKIRPGEPPQIVFAGRFVPQKNPLQIIRTLARLRHLPWHCVLAGDGPLRLEMEAEIERQDLGERFTLPGWITPEQVIDCYRESDVLFMPSLSEGFPVAGVQGLAMGLAVVASRIGGWMDLVNPGENGFLVDPEDEQGYFQALQCLLTDPHQLLGFRHASRSLAKKFDLSAIVEQYTGVYREATLK
jgi:glycosyltransferase involved in cell wall biosynthesis